MRQNLILKKKLVGVKVKMETHKEETCEDLEIFGVKFNN